jgi:hypothetical protein
MTIKITIPSNKYHFTKNGFFDSKRKLQTFIRKYFHCQKNNLYCISEINESLAFVLSLFVFKIKVALIFFPVYLLSVRKKTQWGKSGWFARSSGSFLSLPYVLAEEIPPLYTSVRYGVMESHLILGTVAHSLEKQH